MSSPNSSSPCIKKHKKHKSEKRERDDKPGGLKLILKVGSQNTPEHITDFTQSLSSGLADNDDLQLDPNDPYFSMSRSHHKKSKKKKKKKDKNKDREKRHKHHHKEKKRKREENEEEILGWYTPLLTFYVSKYTNFQTMEAVATTKWSSAAPAPIASPELAF